MPDHVDLAPALAAFLLSPEGRAFHAPEALMRTCRERWPDMRPDEMQRGLEIAREVLHADAAEHSAEADRLKREYGRRFGQEDEVPRG